MKLQHVISNIMGKTGMKIIEAIVRGERNPRKLAGLRDPRTRADEAAIARSLQGHWREEHIFELTQAGALPDLSGQDLRVDGRLKGSWSGLRTAAMAHLPLGMPVSAARGTRLASTFGATCTA